MKLLLQRKRSNSQCTIGELYVDGQWECFTLEDIVRARKIKGKTAIPAGTYKIELTMSPHFKRILPLLEDVKNFSGVRIHSGNVATDSNGCILVGTAIGANSLSHSRDAFGVLFNKMEYAISKGDTISITIKNYEKPTTA